MEQLYVFGTGNAAVTHCYNTCFGIRDNSNRFFMVDAGGGNGILRILEDMKIPFEQIHDIFITHEHTDHILGIVWMVRFIATRIKTGLYDGDLNIYCHEDLAPVVDTICRLTIQNKLYQLIGDRIHLVPVHDGETLPILNYDVTFFDIHSTKARQFGFTTLLENHRRLTCAGDEPYNPVCRPFVEGSDWLLHEAFCLYSEREIFKPTKNTTARSKTPVSLPASFRFLIWFCGIPKTVPLTAVKSGTWQKESNTTTVICMYQMTRRF